MVFGLSVSLSVILFFLASPDDNKPVPWNEPESLLIFSASLLILIFGAMPLFKMPSIRIDKHHIVFQRYLLSSIIKTVDIKNYDYYKIVQEESENGSFEAVWLIKDKKLVDSFSTYQYSNYGDLKTALDLKNKGHLELSPMKQLWCKLGGKI